MLEPKRGNVLHNADGAATRPYERCGTVERPLQIASRGTLIMVSIFSPMIQWLIGESYLAALGA